MTLDTANSEKNADINIILRSAKQQIVTGIAWKDTQGCANSRTSVNFSKRVCAFIHATLVENDLNGIDVEKQKFTRLIYFYVTAN